MDHWQDILTDGPILDILLQSLSPFLWGVVASCSREAKEFVDIQRFQTRKLVIDTSGRRHGFAGLLLFTNLNHIILTRSKYGSPQDQAAEFDAHWFWLLVEQNIGSLVKLEMWAPLAEYPGHDSIEGIQTFNGYVQHLFRCTRLRELAIEMPPPSGFGTGQLLRRLFAQLRNLSIHSSGWYIDDWHNAVFSANLADGSAFLTNLIKLDLSWEGPSTNEEEPSEDEHPHPFIMMMSCATFERLQVLILVGYVWSQLMLRTCVDFVNRHSSTLTTLQIALNNGGKMRGATELLAGLQIMHRVSHLMLPPPWSIDEDLTPGLTPFIYTCRSVHLKLDTIARVFPAVECIALVFEPCFYPHIMHRLVLKRIRSEYLKLFGSCSRLTTILEIPLRQASRDDKLPLSGFPSEVKWTSSIVGANQQRGPLANCWGWKRGLQQREIVGPLLLHHTDLQLVRPNCLGL